MSPAAASSARLRGVSLELALITGSCNLGGYSVFTTKGGRLPSSHSDKGGKNHVPDSLPISSLIVDSASSPSLPSYDSLLGEGDSNRPGLIEQSVQPKNGSYSQVPWMLQYDPSMYQSEIDHRK